MTVAQLALVCAVAILGPLLSISRFVHLPVVIGELVVGIILGASGFHVLSASDPTFRFLGDDIGFALVMFVVGSHVPIRSPGIRTGLSAGLARAVLIAVLAVPAGLAIATLFGTGHGLLYAVLLASSSASIVMPSLDGLPLTGAPILATLAQLAVADALCIVLLPLAVTPARALGRAAVGEPRRLARQLFALTEGFFAPIFFVWLGAGLDLHAVVREPSLLALGVALGLGATLVHATGHLLGQPLPLAVSTAADAPGADQRDLALPDPVGSEFVQAFEHRVVVPEIVEGDEQPLAHAFQQAQCPNEILRSTRLSQEQGKAELGDRGRGGHRQYGTFPQQLLWRDAL